MGAKSVAILSIDRKNITDAQATAELRELCRTIGFNVKLDLVQNLASPHPRTLLGSGFLEQAKNRLAAEDCTTAVINTDLSPAQGRNIQKILGCPVLDRTQIILQIFHNNAKTHAARIQVELAELEYMLPRLVGMWQHLDREKGGIASSKGTGEKQIAIDRSLVKKRIIQLKKDLDQIETGRISQKKQRHDCWRVSLAGYTNAGKSTIMNKLTDANLLVENKLFATLDSTTRTLPCYSQPPILISDTVGFISELPHQLVASFYSTLQVICDSDLILHVIDCSDALWKKHLITVEEALAEIESNHIPKLLIFNKIDLLLDGIELAILRKKHPEAIFFEHGLPAQLIIKPIQTFFEKGLKTMSINISPDNQGDLATLYRLARVDSVDLSEGCLRVTVVATPANAGRIRASINAVSNEHENKI